MDSYKVTSFENCLYKVYKIFLVLLLQIVVHALGVSIFKDLELDVVIDIINRRKVDSLTPFPSTFIDLLAYIRHVI
jgi:hypothetical protein